MSPERSLIVVTIAHTYGDLGSLKDKIPFDGEYEGAVILYWKEIFDYLFVDSFLLSWAKNNNSSIVSFCNLQIP